MIKSFFATMFALLISASAYANNNANIQGVAFGTNYETALAGIKSQFGTPLSANKRQIVYKNMTFKGVKFDKATFNFQTDSLGNTYFSEARFTSTPVNKKNALKDVEALAKTMDKDYPGVTIDWEDDDMPFYKGGLSPIENNYLFTVCIYPSGNAYTTVLRYGPLPYVRN
ncbi:hypothetical protein [Hoylesella loescheii]|jgi:hypothetical protein|uniref:hypothetical protein n=1 Tax=Hoylesella loescheii TaxID=840 RepID=UPI0028E248B6|nr:hypothetical protein [Hoylesella loescheii]